MYRWDDILADKMCQDKTYRDKTYRQTKRIGRQNASTGITFGGQTVSTGEKEPETLLHMCHYKYVCWRHTRHVCRRKRGLNSMWAEIVSAQKENVSSLNLKFSHFQRNLIGLSHESENDNVLIGWRTFASLKVLQSYSNLALHISINMNFNEICKRQLIQTFTPIRYPLLSRSFNTVLSKNY